MNIKNYLSANKSTLFIFFGIFLIFGLYNTISYCMPGILLPAITYFSGLSPEFYVGKIIDKVFEYSPLIMGKAIEYTPNIAYGVGYISLGGISLLGGIKLVEYGYNWRYFTNQYVQNTPVVGSLLKGANTTYKWWTNKDLTNVEYTYFYPKIASALGYPDLFNKKLEIDLTTFNSNLTSRESHIEYRDRTVFVDSPISVTEFKDKPVYVPVVEYRDRENLVEINNNIQIGRAHV